MNQNKALLLAFGMGCLTFLGYKNMNSKYKLEMLKIGKPFKDTGDVKLEFDPKSMNIKFSNKTGFEVQGHETIIKEVPVVPGFKKTKKVRVCLDENGNEIPGTEEDVV
jgi:hypothetical protein